MVRFKHGVASPDDSTLCAYLLAAELIEYETEVEALDDTLTWLVSGAARLKALIADAAGGAAEAAKAWQVPAGIMPPLQEKSVIGQVGSRVRWCP